MPPAVRIEGDAFSDVRYEELAELLGLADADHARGKMARLWGQCTGEKVYALPRSTVERVLGPGGIDALVKSRLGVLQKDGLVRIRGTKGRIEWLEKLKNNGKKGGRPPITKRLPSGSAESNPLTTATALTTAPAIANQNQEREALAPLASPSVPAKAKKPKPSDLTPAEVASATTVLGKITSRTGVEYGGRGGEAHLRLVVARLRDGVTERELRAVIAYCWSDAGLNWASKSTGDGEAMSLYLRPETLFGPKTIHKYLPHARAWLAKHYADEAKEPARSEAPVLNLFARHETEAS